MNIHDSLPNPRIGDLWVNPHTNEILNDPGEIESPSLRHYFGRDVEAALSAWGGFEGELAALADVKKILDAVVKAEGSPIYEVFFPDAKGYVTVVLECLPDQGSAFINWGFVDHRFGLEGSVLARNGTTNRTFLPTSYGSNSAPKSLPTIPTVLCPNCFLLVPVTGQCGSCDWLPDVYCD